jgi:hypothetical protein
LKKIQETEEEKDEWETPMGDTLGRKLDSTTRGGPNDSVISKTMKEREIEIDPHEIMNLLKKPS